MTFTYNEHTSALPGHMDAVGASHPKLTSSNSPAEPIPRIEAPDDAMPPLPPLRHALGCSQPQQQPDGMRGGNECRPSPPSFASGYGSMASSSAVNGPSYQQRYICNTMGDRDEEHVNCFSTYRPGESLRQEFGVNHALFQFKSPADIHTGSMKKRLGLVQNVTTSLPRSLLSASATDLLSQRPSGDNQYSPTFRVPVQLPVITSGVLGSPARLTVAPMHSAISPRNTLFRDGVQSPNDNSVIDRVPLTRTKRNKNDGATSMQQSYHVDKLENIEIEEPQSLKQSYIDDARRAKSQTPRVASIFGKSSLRVQPNLFCVHGLGPHGSPTRHLATLPRAASVPPVLKPRSSFCTSTTYMQAPRLITAKTFGCRSSVSESPGGVSVTSCNSSDNIPTSLSPSLGASVSDPGLVSSRGALGAKIRKITKMQKPGGCKVQCCFIWECSPKQQKKYESVDKVNAHKVEKQYECSTCGTRFGNKNEAKQHLNSLHHRRRSWSCSALSGYNCAFYDSTDRPGQTDICCYCGDEFPRSGHGPGIAMLSDRSTPGYVTDHDWDERIKHLKRVHGFEECNSFKKFYRADHFRQHLKHSHASKGGKWINVLENACMLDED